MIYLQQNKGHLSLNASKKTPNELEMSIQQYSCGKKDLSIRKCPIIINKIVTQCGLQTKSCLMYISYLIVKNIRNRSLFHRIFQYITYKFRCMCKRTENYT